MAGTIFGLPLSQRVDLNGLPSVGWLLYLYAANTSTPVNSYQDQALTVLNPWPVAADASGMMRQFWLADGSYRVRATNADGSITYFDQPSVLALGASSGSAPSGGVDPNAIFATGHVDWQPVSGTRAGWVRDNGRTIGSATSGAAERANADCQALFLFLWNTYDNTRCPVSGGRGASALADWTANKQIATLDMRGCTPAGLDSMGNSAANLLTDIPFDVGDKDTAGSVCGEIRHTLAEVEMPDHTHSFTGDAMPNHSHTATTDAKQSVAGALAGSGSTFNLTSASVTVNAASAGTPSGTIGNTGGGADFNIMQRSVLGTFYRKL